jgi:hypothetical protein
MQDNECPSIEVARCLQAGAMWGRFSGRLDDSGLCIQHPVYGLRGIPLPRRS